MASLGIMCWGVGCFAAAIPAMGERAQRATERAMAAKAAAESSRYVQTAILELKKAVAEDCCDQSCCADRCCEGRLCGKGCCGEEAIAEAQAVVESIFSDEGHLVDTPGHHKMV
mmetsp:Transcript_121428/g.259267  ORF Transcript_121428/g.259267 Transcript_121428/m.259267 type:complete len:114 (+) Transcript_121428:66-407(+)